MLHTVFIALTWLIGALGLTGALAVIAGCVWLGPTAVIAIARPLLSKFIACARCVALTAAITATVAAYWVGHHQAERQCRADELAAALRNAEIDRDNALQAKADEARRADTIEAATHESQQQAADYIATLQSRATPACVFDDRDAGGLRGGAGAGGAHPAAGAGADHE